MPSSSLLLAFSCLKHGIFSPNIGVILYKADNHLHNVYCILFSIEIHRKKYNTTSSISNDLSCIWTGEAPFHDRTV